MHAASGPDIDAADTEPSGKGNEPLNDHYKLKYKRLRKSIIEIVHQNAAICQEISRNEEKINDIKTERKFLLKKLMQYEKPKLKSLQITSKKNGYGSKAKKRTTIGSTKTKESRGSKTKGNVVGGSALGANTAKSDVIRIQPIQVDECGRPIFPIEIGDLSVYSIGEIVHDRPRYHESKYLFPVGYCSTKLLSNDSTSDQQCLYTCKILDNGPSPRFEISPEDSPETIYSSSSIEEAYASFHKTVAPQDPETMGLGAYEFFGLSNPTIQNLIQSLPGACRCVGYEWKKIEVVHHRNGNPKSKPGRNRARQSDINIEALEKWARDTT